MTPLPGYASFCNTTTESHIWPFSANLFIQFFFSFSFSITPVHDLNLFPVMASDGSPSQDSQKKKKKTCRKDTEVQVEVQIEQLTACGHSALKQGDSSKALEYFRKAFKTAVHVRKGLRD